MHRDCQLVLGSAASGSGNMRTSASSPSATTSRCCGTFLAIERLHWDLIILDEGQRIKNWEAQTSRVIKGLKSPFALVLSGTPLENRLEELYSVAQFVDDRRLGPAFRFLNRYRMADETGRVLGYGNLAELRRTGPDPAAADAGLGHARVAAAIDGDRPDRPDRGAARLARQQSAHRVPDRQQAVHQ